MAKKDNKKTNFELERKKSEAAEKKLQELKQKEKEKKKKDRAQYIKKKEKKERKRINTILNYPFSVLFRVSMLASIIYFIYIFIGNEVELPKALLNSFLVFSAFYLGAGVIMVTTIYVMSEKKKVELEEQRKIEEEQRKIDEEERLIKQQQMEEEFKQAEARRHEELRRFRELQDIEEAKNSKNIENIEGNAIAASNYHPLDFDEEKKYEMENIK